MSKKTLVIMMVVGLVVLNTSFASALQQAEVDAPTTSIFYGVQTLNGELMAANLGGEVGLSSNFAIEGLATYYQENYEAYNEDNIVVDLNSKINIVNEEELSVSAIAGMHTQTDGEGAIYPRVGMLVSKHETSDLDINAGLDFLLKKDEDYLGYMLGFDYRLTPDIHLEIEHRRFSGQAKTEGLNVGLRYYF